MQLSHVTAFWLRLAANILLDLFLHVHEFCTPAEFTFRTYCRLRVPELGPCFGSDHPNCGSMEARRSSEFYGCCPVRRHRGNFAGTHTGKTKAERTRYPITAETSLFHSRQRLFVVP